MPEIQGYKFSIDLDDGGMTRSLKELRNEAKLLKSAMRANFAEINSTGDAMKAYAGKANDAKRAIDGQRTVIERLKKEQSGLDTSTIKGRDAYAKYEKQINQAKTEIGSLTAQQKRAKDSAELYRSGVLQLKKSIEMSQQSTKNNVRTLQAEGKEYSAQKAKLNGLADVHQKMARQLNAEKTRLGEIAKTSGTASDAYHKQQVRISGLTADYKQNEAQIKQVNRAVGGMSSRMIAVKDVTSNLSKRVRTGFSSIRTGAMGASVGIGLVGAAMFKGAKRATNLQNEYKKTTNLLVTGGERSAEAIRNVNKMQRDGEHYSIRYGKSQDSIALGYQELVKRGYSSAQALGAMKTELQASVASGDDFADVVQVSSQTLESFGMRAKSTEQMTKNTKEAVNDLAYAADMTATDFHGIGKGMEYVGATAHNMKFSLAETSAALGVLSNNGLEADKAGTGLRKVLVSLADPGKAAREALGDLGLDTQKKVDAAFKDSKGNFKSIADITAKVYQLSSGMSSSEQGSIFKRLFGTTGMQAGQILGKNSKELRELTANVEKAGKSGSYVEKLANKNSQTALMAQQRFKMAWQDLTTMFGAKLLPYMTEAANSMSKLFAKSSFQKDVKGAAKDTAAFAKQLIRVGSYAAEHYDQVKMIGAAIAGIWAVNKVATFMRSMDEVKKLFTTSAVSISEETAALDANTTAKELNAKAGLGQADSGEVSTLATGAGASGAAKGGLLARAKGALTGGSLLNKVAVAGIGVEMGSHIVGAIRDGVDTTKGGRQLWTAAGNAVGAGAGFALGGPVGATVGSVIGGSIAKKLSGTKFVKDMSSGMTKNETKRNKSDNQTRGTYNHLRIDPYGSTTTLNDPTDPSLYATKSKPKKPTKKKPTDPLAGLSKANKDFIKDTQKLLTKANKGYLSIMATGSKSAMSTNRKTYADLVAGATKYQKSQDKNVSYLEKMGLISKKTAQQEESSGNKRIAAIKSTVAKIDRAEKSGSSNRFALVAKLNRQLLKLTSTGANKQRDIIRKLNLNQTSLTNKQYKSVMAQSRKAYASTIRDAKKSYSAQTNAAYKTYRKSLSTAAKVYGVHSKEYNRIKTLAQRQYDKTTSAARQQYVKVTYWAERQRDAATKAAANAAGGVMGIMGVMSNNIQTVLKQNAAAVGGKYKAPISNVQALQKDFGKPALKGGSNVSNQPNGGLPGAYHFAVGSNKKYPKGLTRDTDAIVNDGKAPEAIILPGRNRHVVLPKGAHVLNADDTRKAFGPQHFAGGTVKLATSKYQGINIINGNKKSDDGTKNMSKDYADATKKSTKSLNKFKKSASKTFNDIDKDTKKKNQTTRDNTVKLYDSMQKGSVKQMSQMYKGTKAYTKDIYTNFQSGIYKLPKYAGAAMASSVSRMNRGFRSINTVLSQFGGNKSVLQMASYARGTGGRLTHDQLAVLNDSNVGPRQEAIVDNKGDIKLPNGKNAVHYLKKGERVLNGYQTQRVANAYGLKHFAKGTGVSESELEKLVMQGLKHPIAKFGADFEDAIGGGNSPVAKATTLAGKGAAKTVGPNWYQAMYSVINDLMGGNSSASKVVRYAKEHFMGKPYLLGGNGPTYYDCAAMVAAALSHFGINIGRTTVAMQTSSGVQGLGRSLSNTRSGDLAIWGHGGGAAGHVGFIDNPQKGTMFNETPPRARVTPLSYVTALPLDQYYRVKGLKSGDDDGPKIDPKLKALAKSQLGGKAVAALKAEFDADMSLGGGPAPTGDHAHWLKQAGMPESWWPYVTAIINRESGWNPRADNPTSDAYGLPQALPGSKMASAGKDWRTNPITQLRWMKSYIKQRYGNAKHAWNIRQTRGWYANGGLINKETTATMGENNRPEMVIPLSAMKSSRGYELLGKTAAIMAKRDGANIGGHDTGDNKAVEKLSKKLDDVIGLLATIVSNQANPTPAVVGLPDLIKKINAYQKTQSVNAKLGRGAAVDY